MTREEAGRRGREIAARARAQKSEYYTDGNTVRHIKPQNRITNPYISKDKNKNKDKYKMVKINNNTDLVFDNFFIYFKKGAIIYLNNDSFNLRESIIGKKYE